MKRILLTCALCFFISHIYSQNTELSEQSWYVNTITLNGVTYQTPITNVVGIVQTNINFLETETYGIIDPESDSFFANVNYSDTQNEFTFTDMSITLPGCQVYCDFASKYFEILGGDFIENVFSYTLTTDGNEQTLTITSQEGNIVVYNNAPILAINNPTIQQIDIYPNPVSNTLQIIYNDEPPTDIIVRNLIGQVVLTQDTNLKEIDVSTIKTGVYIIEVNYRKGKRKKIIKRFVKK